MSDLDDLHKHVRDLASKDFITAQEKFSYMYFLVIDFDSFKRIPYDLKTAGRYSP